jgi:hypothetical protein
VTKRRRLQSALAALWLITAGASVVIRVIDGNDRQIDNG